MGMCPSACVPGADQSGGGSLCIGCERTISSKRLYHRNKGPISWSQVTLYDTQSGAAVSASSEFLVNGASPEDQLREHDLIVDINGSSTFKCTSDLVSKIIENSPTLTVNLTVRRHTGTQYTYHKVTVKRPLDLRKEPSIHTGESGPASWSRVYTSGAVDPGSTMQRMRAMRAREAAHPTPTNPSPALAYGQSMEQQPAHNPEAEPESTSPSTPRSDDSSSIGRPLLDMGLSLVRTSAGAFIVSKVLPDSPAAQCGMIRRGDRLVELDGACVDELEARGGIANLRCERKSNLVLERNIGDGYRHCVPPMVIRVCLGKDNSKSPGPAEQQARAPGDDSHK